MSRNCRSSARNTSSPMPALASAPIAMPASSMVAIEVRPCAGREPIEDRASSISAPRERRRRAARSNGSAVLLAASSRSPSTIAAAAPSPRPSARRRQARDRPADCGTGPASRRRPAASSAPTMMAEHDARQPDRPQDELVARDRRGIARRDPERGRQARERDTGGADARRDRGETPARRAERSTSERRAGSTVRAARRPPRGPPRCHQEQPARLRSDGSSRGRAPDRAQPRDRAPRARCAGRSRADKAHPSRRRTSAPPPASARKPDWRTPSRRRDRPAALHHQHGVRRWRRSIASSAICL